MVGYDRTGPIPGPVAAGRSHLILPTRNGRPFRQPGVNLLGKPYRRAELATKVRQVLDE